MKFALKYAVDDNMEESLIQKVEWENCRGCGEPTTFYDSSVEEFVCSEECRKKVLKEYVILANGE